MKDDLEQEIRVTHDAILTKPRSTQIVQVLYYQALPKRLRLAAQAVGFTVPSVVVDGGEFPGRLRTLNPALHTPVI